jgi:class 3 adenylate cyclase
MPRGPSHQCYRLLMSETPDRKGAVEECAKAIMELGSASALMHDPRQPTLRSLLVSDLVGSTALLHEFGDELGRDFIVSHDALVRDCLSMHGGVEVAHTGDGFIASFINPSRALHCACAMQEAVLRHNESSPRVPMQMRIGVHTGRPIEQDGRLVGACVHDAVRVCSTASGGLVLASQRVVELINPGWFRLVPRGPSQLRGAPEPMKLYEVDWKAGLRNFSN